MTDFTRRSLLSSAGIVSAGLALAACSTTPATTSPSSGAATGTPSGSASSGSASYKKYGDVAYAAAVGNAHLLDLYVPTSGTGPFPVVILQTGSAWRSDDTKDGMSFGGGAGGAGGLPSGGALPSGIPSGAVPSGIPSGAVPSGIPSGALPSGGLPSGGLGGSGGSAGAPNGLGGITTAEGLAKMWAAEGYAIVGLNVRSSSEAHFPAQVYDIKAAIRYLRANASKYNLDSDKFATMGTSSGSWVSMMGGLTGKGVLEGDLGNADQSTEIQAVIDLFGPTDFLQMDAHRVKGGDLHNPASSPESQLMGFAIQTNKSETEKANPINYVSQSSPPIWISHGTADTLVPPYESQILFEKYQKVGGTATFTLVPDATHTDEYLTSASKSAGRTVKHTEGGKTTTGSTPAPTYATLLSFLNEHLK